MQLPGESSHIATAKFKSKKSYRPTKKFLISAGIICIIIILAIAAWVLIPSKDQAVKNSPAASSVENTAAAQPDDSIIGATELSESHTNDFLRITFKYPKNWQVSDENDVILVKSPTFKQTLADGSTSDGFFKIYMKQQAGSSDGKFLGRGYALSLSKKIQYSQPQPGQRADTFLTDFGLDDTSNFAYFIVQGVFDLKKGETLGPKYVSETDAYLITGGFGSAELSEPLETNLLAVDSYSSQDAYKTGLEIVKTLQLK